jgi:hypothetical protein
VTPGQSNQPKKSINHKMNEIEDLQLMWEPSRYKANNAPNGCPTSSGGKVVSNVTVWGSGIDALDQIYDVRGNLIVNTPIEYRRINSIPEPSLTIGLLALGIGCVSSVCLGKQKHKSKYKEKTFV